MDHRLTALIIGYCCGCFLTAEPVARLRTGRSAFSLGSGNPGMANMVRQLGLPWGLLVLTGDLLKTGAACLLSRLIAPGPFAVLYAGLGTALGHNYPLWHRFHGGKGVAVTCACLVLFSPIAGGACCLAGLAVTLATGWLPLGAVVIPSAFLVPAFLLWGPEAGLLALVFTLLMLQRHFHGLQRICHGTETKALRRKSREKL